MHSNSEPLLDDTDEDSKSIPPPERTVRGLTQKATIPPVLTIIIWALAAYGALQGLIQLHDLSSELLADRHPPCWCGTSDEEAVSLGCIYDHLAVDWLPPRCIDRELVDMFDASGPEPDGSWPYYSLGVGQDAFSRVNASDIDDYALSGLEYWATVEWHVAHCLFTWRKQFRAGFRRESIEPWNMREGHVEHCTEYVLEALRERWYSWQVNTLILGRDRHVEESASFGQRS